MTDVPQPDGGLVTTLGEIVAAGIAGALGWLHVRVSGERRDREADSERLWSEINTIKRDWRELFTKKDAHDMEERLTRLIVGKPGAAD